MKQNIAIFPAGSEIGFEIHAALKNNKKFNVLALSSCSDHSDFIYDHVHRIGQISDDNFLEQLNQFIDENAIDILFPAHDLFLDWLVGNIENIKCKVASHDPATIAACRSKSDVYGLFPELSPKINPPEFPSFAKPNDGFGGLGSFIINDYTDLNKAVKNKLLVCEYLPGNEYTVDCFTDSTGKLIVAHSRKRDRIKNGIAVRSVTPFDASFSGEQYLISMAEKINSVLKFNGAWFFQAKLNKEFVPKLLEIAPRIAGTSGLTRMNGANLSLMTIENMNGNELDCATFGFVNSVDRALSSKYFLNYEYDNLYIDLDDTLIVNKKVNTEAIALIYQCMNADKNVYLITRNKAPKFHLLGNSIDPNIFDDIIQVPDNKDKSEFIKSKSIFIDDSFKERIDVFDTLQIPVFDVSEIAGLLE